MITYWRVLRELRFQGAPIPAGTVLQEAGWPILTTHERELVKRRHAVDCREGCHKHIVVRWGGQLRFIRPEDLEPPRWWVVDTETTGSGAGSVVIEIGIAVVEAREVVDVRSCLVRATRAELAAQHARVRAVHGISDAEVLKAPPRDAVGARLARWYAESGSPPCTAWPIAFDKKMVERTWGRQALPLRWPKAGCLWALWKRCVATEAKKKRAPALAKAAAQLGVALPEGAAHRAGWDAHVAALVFVELLRRQDATHSKPGAAMPRLSPKAAAAERRIQLALDAG